MTPAHGRAAGTRMGVRQPPLRGMAPGETHAYTVFFEKFFGGGNRGPPMHPSISKVAAKSFRGGRAAVRFGAWPCPAKGLGARHVATAHAPQRADLLTSDHFLIFLYMSRYEIQNL